MLPKRLLKKILNSPPQKLPGKILRGFRHYILKYPSRILLQTVSACNLKCEHCFVNNYGIEIPDGKKKILSYEEFSRAAEKLKKAIKYAEFFQFTTFEPTLNKNLFKMMDLVLSINPKIRFPILTNCMLVTKEYISELSKYPISEFTVSLDGVKKETVESFKTGVSYDRIIGAMKLHGEIGFAAPLQSVFVLHKRNYKELADYPDFVAQFGVKNIYVNNLLSFTPKFRDLYMYSPQGSPEVEEIFVKTIERVRANGQTIELPSMKPELKGCSTCEILIVDNNGAVVPCDFLAVGTPFEMFGETQTSKPVIFGNVFEDEPLRIFSSKKAEVFRNVHRNSSAPKECSLCIDAYGLMCSNRRKYS